MCALTRSNVSLTVGSAQSSEQGRERAHRGHIAHKGGKHSFISIKTPVVNMIDLELLMR